jgi:uncharacterized protein YukE
VVFGQLLQRVAEARARALQAAQAAQEERRRRREENDQWVTAGVNWNGFGLESLIKMVAHKSSPAQLEALAGEWSRHGGAVAQVSDDLEKSLTKLLQFWSGTAADEAARKVVTNARWIGELGSTAQQMERPILDAAGALRSAQDTMPGMPKNNWMATAGGGAAAGMVVAGPIGAAFGAAIGGIASAFGFGNKKKKMKKKAVQTMERFEGALVGVDQLTPQFPGASNGANPGDNWVPAPDDGISRPGVPLPPIAGGPVKPGPAPVDGGSVTDPSFAVGGPESRWQSLTGLGPNAQASGLGTGGGPGSGVGFGAGGLGGLPPGMAGRGAGAGGSGRGGAGGRGVGGRGAGAGFPGGMGGAGGRGDRDYRGRGRFSKGGAFGPGGGVPGGRRGEDEEDGEYRRSVPIEEDLFSSDEKAAPPVIGL